MRKLFFLLVFMLFSFSAQAQTTYFVKTDGNNLNDGKSWTNALATITKAIEISEEDDEIKVASGVYFAPETYVIDKSLTIIGGIDENGNQQLLEKTIIDGQGLHKIMKIVEPITGIPVHVTLSGLSFTNGFNNDTSNASAIEFMRASGMIKNCDFKNNNSISSDGGALSFEKSVSKSTIVNCLFKENSAKNGGAIFSGQRTSLDLINCTITQNVCADTGLGGGGVYTDGILNLYNSILWGNKKGFEDDQINGKGKFHLNHNILQGGIRIDNINNNLQSNMVLQQNDKITLSGYSASNHEIKVSCSWETEPNYFTTNTSENGLWVLPISTPSASLEPVIITIEGREIKQFTNILIGEVWLCSGQSNMKYRVKDVLNASAELSTADNYSNIRLLNMEQKQSEIPLNDYEDKWEVCSSATISNFSAVAYFFGRKLYEDLNVPIGLINSSWGDTTAEVWVNRDSVLNTTDTSVLEGTLRNDKMPRVTPSTAYKIGSAYNAMIHPLKNIPTAGAIWYQGESNQGYPYYYPGLIKILVNNWRNIWQKDNDDFPFYIAQICPFNRLHNFPTYYSNPAMRYMQSIASNLISNCEIESNDDIANLTDIHPKNKQDVGMRLAWLALNSTYNKKEYAKNKTAQYVSYLVNQNQLIVTFDNAGDGLKTKDGLTPTMFEICGSDKIFYPANAVVSGTNQVILTSPDVSEPIAARLGWSYIHTTNLVNSENLPVSVFRTYDWMDEQEEPK